MTGLLALTRLVHFLSPHTLFASPCSYPTPRPPLSNLHPFPPPPLLPSPLARPSQSFHWVYGGLFERLAKQEARAWEERGAAKAAAAGDSDDDGGAAPTLPKWVCGAACMACLQGKRVELLCCYLLVMAFKV